MIFAYLVLFLLIVFLSNLLRKEVNKGRGINLLRCPIRGLMKVKKYDSNGKYSEEFQRIRLIKYLLLKGYSKKHFLIEYVVNLGYKGRNSLRIDLVVKNKKRFIIVVEVKKVYSKRNKELAIKYQLIPAISLLNSKYGIYYDGTINSCVIIKHADGSFSQRKLKVIS
jgi:hypothetical protein